MHQESENSHTRRPSTPLKSISTSWYRPAESPKSEGQSSNASITKVVHDLDDAFDDREEDISTGFVVGHSLKRESVGGKIDVKAIISPPDFKVEIAAAEEDFPPEIRGMIHIQGQGHGDRECVQRPNLSPASLTSSSSLGDQSRTQTPPNLRRNSDIVEVPASPNTPSIVISRPPSPTEHLQAEFMDVSLTPDVERKPPLPSRSPIPAPIIVPPLNNLSNVEIIQTARSPPPTFGHTSTKSESSIVPNSQQPQTAKLPPSTSEPQSISADASSSNQKRPRRATGLTNTQDVVSKTRPKHLPPKDREEDLKHLRVWKEMMEKSRLADEQRKKEQQNRRLAREMAVDASLHIWEREVLPDWKAAIRNPKLRKLWWKGIPTKIRGQVWGLTLGNELSLSKEAYKSCLARAKRAIAINSFPEDSMREIEEDIRGTLPALHLFHPETGPMYEDLKSILCAWLVARSDEGLGYVSGQFSSKASTYSDYCRLKALQP
ncbi:hypothetical protein FRC02_004291 [Tulasnella sp. 418]|nr:hypothetical protein FRC02_004291 [Tulasnella sp. 418]